MVKFEESVVIERPLEQVFAFVSDPRNDTEWSEEIAEVRQTSEGPLGVGTSFRTSASAVPRSSAACRSGASRSPP